MKGWPLHKHECKELGDLRLRLENGSSTGSWTERIEMTGASTRIGTLLSCLPKCNTCLKTRDLKTCYECFSAWGCRDHAVEEHNCNQVRVGRLVNMFIVKGYEPVLVEGDVPATAPLVSWVDYWKQKPIVGLSKDHSMFPVATMITEDALSSPMTIVSCLRRLSPPLDFGEHLVIHFVGSDLGEIYKHARGMEEVMHWVGAQHMTVVFVGPDIPKSLDGQSGPLQCCPSCCAKKRTRTASYATGLYHNVISKLPRPHVCFVQNSGVHDTKLYPEWQHSVDVMIDMRIVLIFTSYTEGERNLDAAFLERRGGKVIHSALNEFRTPIVMDDPALPGCVFQSSQSVTLFDNRSR